MRKLLPALTTLAALATAGACESTSVATEDAAAAAALENGDTTPTTDDATARPHRGPRLELDCSLPAMEERVIDHYDADDDGTLTAEEGAALNEDFEGDGPPPPPPDGADATGDRPPPPFGPRGHGRRVLDMLVWLYDGNDDGALDDDERSELHADLEARCEARRTKLLADFDTDADGALSDAELEAARAAHEAEMQARFAEMIAEYDTDGDGVLSQAEHQVLHEEQRALRDAERLLFDTNGDGELSGDEEDALKESIQSKIRSGEPPPMPPPPPPGGPGGPGGHDGPPPPRG